MIDLEKTIGDCTADELKALAARVLDELSDDDVFDAVAAWTAARDYQADMIIAIENTIDN